MLESFVMGVMSGIVLGSIIVILVSMLADIFGSLRDKE